MSYPIGIRTRLDTVWATEILAPNGQPWVSVPDLATQRDRARRLERESALAYGILDRAVENIIASGIRIRPKSDSPEFNAEISDLWSEWSDGKNADVRRTYSFGQLQRLACRHELRDGDCGFILIDRTDDGYRWPELQFVGGELIDSPSRTVASKVVDGIEFNNVNAPVAYWIRGADGPERVEARDFVFLHSTTRYNVSRGESRFHGTYRLFDQVEGHIEAVVVAARIAASQAIIAKRKDPRGAIGRLAASNTTQQSDGRYVPAKIIEPGMINFIDTEEDLHGFNPTQPHQDFPGFLRAMARMLGLKFGLTVERVLLDFAGANYSVSRSTALQEQRAAEPAQEDFNACFFARVYPWFVSKMVKLGRVRTEPPQNAWAYEWIPQGRPLVEPSKEAPGLAKLIEIGIEAPEYLATERGYDWTKLLDTLAKNKREFEERGIPWPGQPSAPALPLLEEDE